VVVSCQSIVVAPCSPSISLCSTLSTPCQSKTTAVPTDAMHFLCGGNAPASASELAWRLQAALPDVYED
jgi:hypothetical protein